MGGRIGEKKPLVADDKNELFVLLNEILLCC